MRYSKEKMIKWLEEDIKNLHYLANHYEFKGDSATAKQYRMEAMANQNVLWMMTDDKHFERQYKAFFKEEK